MVTAVIKIEQFDSPENSGKVRGSVFRPTSEQVVYEETFGLDTEYTFNHLPHISEPVSRTSVPGWVTEWEEDWKDSPSANPTAYLYRNRFGFGRDRLETFELGYGEVLSQGAAGARWGNLDDNSGEIVYERRFFVTSQGRLRQFRVAFSSKVREADTSLEGSFRVDSLDVIKGSTDLETYPFLITALPEPFSHKNPVDSDVFIRLSNFTVPLASGTINLYLNGVLKQDTVVTEFFGGLGGYDLTWDNSQVFSYDEMVDVRVEFEDTDTPVHRYKIAYPFYTVEDLAAPRVTEVVPVNNADEVPVNGSIQFTVEDYENDVDIDTLSLFVNNVPVVNGVHGGLEVTRLENLRGYTVRYSPYEEWLYGDVIPVAFFVKDTSVHGNELFYTFSFRTAESSPPVLVAYDPHPCARDVPTGKGITVDIVDGGHGLDRNSIIFSTDEVDRVGSIILLPIIRRND